LVADGLPKLRLELDSEWLDEVIADHLERTRAHVDRLEQVFLALDAEPTAAASESFEGMRRQQEELVEKVVEPRLRDLFLAGAASRVEHLEIAIYSALVLLAGEVGVEPEPLELTLRDEKHALDQLEEAARRLRERLPA
jgi:ferritin-like metal-binding protein YciE